MGSSAEWWIGALIGWFIAGHTISGIGLALGGAIGGLVGAGNGGATTAYTHYTNQLMTRRGRL